MPDSHEPLLINTLGHSAGALIFGIFLFLLLRDRRGSRLSIAAAALAFAWNVGSLLVLTQPTPSDWTAAWAFSFLSLLPAVLLHLSLKGRRGALAAAGYALSAVAVAMHFLEISLGPEHHRIALLLITIGFSALTAVAVILTGGRALATAMALALFSMSFVHFGSGDVHQAWSSELAFHHAGIPLALFILLQDYRFVLLDAFVRFLANVLLAALVAFGVMRVTGAAFDLLPFAAACALLILFASTRGLLQRWLTRVVFRRPDLDRVLADIRARDALAAEPEYFAWAARRLADFVETSEFECVPASRLRSVLPVMDLSSPAPAADAPQLRAEPSLAWAEALVPLRIPEGEPRYALLGRRSGGRRYLSEDLDALGRIARAVVEQFERARSIEMQRLVSQAELRALQSQINPHFLFNALNTLYGVIPREAAGARRTVLNLSDIFRYFLQTDRTFIPLSEEVQIIKAYLEIEKLRLGARLNTEIDIDEAALDTPIPVLSIEPLVENAVKHGVAPSPKPELVRLTVRQSESEIEIIVENTGQPGSQPQTAGAGVGLANVTRRLQLCYGPETRLDIDSNGTRTEVRFRVPVRRAPQDLAAQAISSGPAPR